MRVRTLDITPVPPPVVRVRQRPIETEAVNVDVMRRHIITATWKLTLPLWLVAAIRQRTVFIHWQETMVDGMPAFKDDWIVRQADGSLAVFPPEAFAATFEAI